MMASSPKRGAKTFADDRREADGVLHFGPAA